MSAEPQQRLNFFPLPQGQGSFRPTFTLFLTGCPITIAGFWAFNAR
jgi:hypothetical protein